MKQMDKKVKWVVAVLVLTVGSLMTSGIWSALLSLTAFSLLFTLVARNAWRKDNQSQDSTPQPFDLD